MKYLLITGQTAGQALMFEKLGKQGRRKLVPAYHAEMGDEKRPGSIHHFQVTRDVSDILFGYQSERFASGGECPPHRTSAPYQGFWYNHPKIGATLRIVEPRSPDSCTLWGTERIERRHILVHRGPARSEGCFCIAGGTKAHLTWSRALLNIVSSVEDPITVFVEPRPVEHHNTHLSRFGG